MEADCRRDQEEAGVQDPGLNPSRDILPGSALFRDLPVKGLGTAFCRVLFLHRRIFKVGNHRGSAFSFTGDAVEVPERMQPVEPGP